jgi:hypothetical protein
MASGASPGSGPPERKTTSDSGILVASHPRNYLPLAQHRTLQAPLEGKPLPNVLPHTIEAGKDAYYIGDVYDPLPTKPWHLGAEL